MWSIIGVIGVLAAPPPPAYLVVDDVRAAIDTARKHPHIHAALTRGELARLLAVEGDTPDDLTAMLNDGMAFLPRRFEIAADEAGAAWLGDRLMEATVSRGDGRVTLRLNDIDCATVKIWADWAEDVLGEAPTIQCDLQPVLSYGVPLPPADMPPKALLAGRWDFSGGPLNFTVTRRKGALVLDGRLAATPSATLPAPPARADFAFYDDGLDIAKRMATSPLGMLPFLQGLRGGMLAIRHRKPRAIKMGTDLVLRLPMPELVAAVGVPDASGLLTMLTTFMPGTFQKIDLGLGLPTWRLDPASSDDIQRFEFDGTFHLVEGPGWLAFGTDPTWTRAALKTRLPPQRHYVFRGKRDGLLKFAADGMLTSWRLSGERSWTESERSMWMIAGELARAFTVNIHIDDADGARRLSGTLRWAKARFAPLFKTKWSPAKVRDWLERYCDSKAWVHPSKQTVKLPQLAAGPVLLGGQPVLIPHDGPPLIFKESTQTPREQLAKIRSHWPADWPQATQLIILADQRARTEVVEAILTDAHAVGFKTAVLAVAAPRVAGPDEPDRAYERRLDAAPSREAWWALTRSTIAECSPMAQVMDVYTPAQCQRLLAFGTRTLPWCGDRRAGEVLTILPQAFGPAWTGHALTLNPSKIRISTTHPRWGDAAAALIKTGKLGLK